MGWFTSASARSGYKWQTGGINKLCLLQDKNPIILIKFKWKKSKAFYKLLKWKRGIDRKDFIIDKLTNSIKNAVKGDSFKKEISILTKDDLLFTTLKKMPFDLKHELKKPLTGHLQSYYFRKPILSEGISLLRLIGNYRPHSDVVKSVFGQGEICNSTQICLPIL